MNKEKREELLQDRIKTFAEAQDKYGNVTNFTFGYIEGTVNYKYKKSTEKIEDIKISFEAYEYVTKENKPSAKGSFNT